MNRLAKVKYIEKNTNTINFQDVLAFVNLKE